MSMRVLIMLAALIVAAFFVLLGGVGLDWLAPWMAHEGRR